MEIIFLGSGTALFENVKSDGDNDIEAGTARTFWGLTVCGSKLLMVFNLR